MDLKTFAEHMWPFWILGVMVMGTVIAAGQKNMLRVEVKPLLKWFAFLGAITLFRFGMAKLFNMHAPHGAEQVTVLPWPVSLTVFWEDLCHALPLVIFRKLLPMKWWNAPIHWLALIAVMLEFGLGHMYQGLGPAFLLSFYVPYTMQKGDQYGFGTIMLCHMTYDLSTLLFVKYMLGA